MNQGRRNFVDADAAQVRNPTSDCLPLAALRALLLLREGGAGKILLRKLVKDRQAARWCRQFARSRSARFIPSSDFAWSSVAASKGSRRGAVRPLPSSTRNCA